MKLYRYERQYVGISTNLVEIKLKEFNVIKETPCGYWIMMDYSMDKQWVSKTAKKRYAYPEKEKARINILKRTKRHLRLLRFQLEVAEEVLIKAETLNKNDENK